MRHRCGGSGSGKRGWNTETGRTLGIDGERSLAAGQSGCGRGDFTGTDAYGGRPSARQQGSGFRFGWDGDRRLVLLFVEPVHVTPASVSPDCHPDRRQSCGMFENLAEGHDVSGQLEGWSPSRML